MKKLKIFISSVQNEFATERQNLFQYLMGDPLLAEPMYLAGYIERIGTGTSDMIRLSKEAHLKEPDFLLEDGFKTVLWRPATSTGQATGQATGQDSGEVTGKLLGKLVGKLVGKLAESF